DRSTATYSEVSATGRDSSTWTPTGWGGWAGGPSWAPLLQAAVRAASSAVANGRLVTAPAMWRRARKQDIRERPDSDLPWGRRRHRTAATTAGANLCGLDPPHRDGQAPLRTFHHNACRGIPEEITKEVRDL